MTSSSLDKTIDVRHYVKVLWRRKGLLILSTTSVLCATLISLSFMPDVYEARATIFYSDNQEVIAELRSGKRFGTGREAAEERSSYVLETIRSTPFLQNVVRDLGMNADPRVRARAEELHRSQPDQDVENLATRIAIEELRPRIKIALLGLAGIYEVAITDTNPAAAQSLTNIICENFTGDVQRRETERLVKLKRSADEEIAVLTEDVRRAEEELETYQRSQIGQDLSTTAVNPLNYRFTAALLRRIHAHVEMAKSRTAPSLRAATVLQKDQEVRKIGDAYKEELSEDVERLLDEAASGSAEGIQWPPESILRTELNNVLARRAQELHPKETGIVVTELSSSVFSSIDIKVNLDLAHSLEERIQEYQNIAKNEPEEGSALRRLQKNVEDKRSILERWEKQRATTTTQQALENQSLGLEIRVMNRAEVPLAPIRPNRMRILLAAFLLGPFLGAGFAFFCETMDSTLRTLDEIQRVAPEPILGTTPLLRKLQQRRMGFRRHWVPTAISGVLVLTAVFFVLRMTVLGNYFPVRRSIQTMATSSSETQSP